MRTASKYVWVALLLTGWDWLATAGTRLVAAQSPWSVLLAASTAAMWWFAVRYCQDTRLATLFVLCAALGTFLGIIYP